MPFRSMAVAPGHRLRSGWEQVSETAEVWITQLQSGCRVFITTLQWMDEVAYNSGA